MKSLLLLCLPLLLSTAGAESTDQPRKISLPAPAELTRADLYVMPTSPDPRAILVLCPGMNGDGSGLLTPGWAEFARRQRLGLVGLSFASSDGDLESGRGYYYPSRGSGKALLDGLRLIFKKDLPILLYGMSGGAHFTARFAEWKPDRVISWCAYSAAWWDRPKVSSCNPPGIVACGDRDIRYSASQDYFVRGRAIGKPWTWVSLADTEHRGSPLLDEFVRRYFAAMLDRKTDAEEWRDVDLKNVVGRQEAKSRPTLACWLPDSEVGRDWMNIHQP